jgi:7,8-dihydropterin-6-yl-methyl-4-(beta-D-ribofuranosyl)aminobenzene 5'-phosphate synthase
VKIRVVVNNATVEGPWLAEHGVAFWVDARKGAREAQILFDTGQTARVLMHNAAIVQVPWGTLACVALSHGHYDHTGGLVEALRACGRRIPVVAHPDAFLPKLKVGPPLREIGVPHRRDEIDGLASVVATRDPVGLADGSQTSGEIPRVTPFEGPEGFLTVRGDRMEPDAVRDDLALFFHDADGGLVVLTGCAHAGIVNTVRHGLTLTGATRVRLVMGGFHLVNASEERIRQTIDALKVMEPERLVPLHCTGDRAMAALAHAFGDRLEFAHVGSEIRV